jgi:hypothetical protein
MRCGAVPYTDRFGNTEEDLSTATRLHSCFRTIIPSNAITINTPIATTSPTIYDFEEIRPSSSRANNGTCLKACQQTCTKYGP